jgi:hypothetical protein
MRATSASRLLGLIGLLLAVPLAHADDRTALVVGIETVSGGDPGSVIEGAAERAVQLGQTLDAAGFTGVTVLTGAQATQAGIRAALALALASGGPDSTLVFFFEGHGIGGDYGDARLLSADDKPDTMSTTAMDVERLSPLLVGADRKVVVITDAVHKGSLAGTELKGPVASDWTNPGPHLAVISATSTGETSTPGLLQAALVAGLEGDADKDKSGAITLGELIHFLRMRVGAVSGGRMTPVRVGGLGDGHLIATAVRAPSPEVVAVAPSAPRTAGRFRSVGVGVAAAGTGLGALSLGMYAAKRGDCQQQPQGLVCGDSAAYMTYRRIQHSMGWAGGILLAAGTGLWFMDTGPIVLGPGTVHWRGQL